MEARGETNRSVKTVLMILSKKEWRVPVSPCPIPIPMCTPGRWKRLFLSPFSTFAAAQSCRYVYMDVCVYSNVWYLCTMHTGNHVAHGETDAHTYRAEQFFPAAAGLEKVLFS